MAWSSFGGGRQLPPEMEEAAEAKRKEFEAAIASAGGPDGTTLPPIRQGKPSGPRTVVCYICGREFGKSSIGIHEKQCAKKWEEAEGQKPPRERKPLPQRPEVRQGASREERNEAAKAVHEDQVMAHCPGCGRRFKDEETMRRHQRSCRPPGGGFGPPSTFGGSGGRQLPPEMEAAAEAQRKEFEAKLAAEGGGRNSPSGTGRPAGPRTVVCYICGREFGKKSIGIHEKQCARKWEETEAQKPPRERKPLPDRPDVAEGSTREERNEAARATHEAQVMAHCPGCGRKFKDEDTMRRHLKSCRVGGAAGPPGTFGGGGRMLPPEMEAAAEAQRKEFEAKIAAESGGASGSDGRSRPAGPRTVVCYICGREFGMTSIGIHEKQCARKWEDAQAQKPPHERKPLPDRPEVREGATREERNEAAKAMHEAQAMAHCECGRRFKDEETLRRHAKSCRAVPRSAFGGDAPRQLPPEIEAAAEAHKREREAKLAAEGGGRSSGGGGGRQPSGPRTVVCYICGREFGKSSLAIHEKQCARKWEEAEAQKPPRERKPLPERPEAQEGATREERNEAARAVHEAQAMAHCPTCGRKFKDEETLRRHQKSCRSTSTGRSASPGVFGGNSGRQLPPEIEAAAEAQRQEFEAKYGAQGGKGGGGKSGGHSSGPRSVVCYICGREYGKSSIGIHEKQCAKKWEDAEATKPPHERKPLPERPNVAEGASREERNEAAKAVHEAQVMAHCPNCNRRFKDEATMHRHLKSCRPRASAAQELEDRRASNASVYEEHHPEDRRASEAMPEEEFRPSKGSHAGGRHARQPAGSSPEDSRDRRASPAKARHRRFNSGSPGEDSRDTGVSPANPRHRRFNSGSPEEDSGYRRGSPARARHRRFNSGSPEEDYDADEAAVADARQPAYNGSSPQEDYDADDASFAEARQPEYGGRGQREDYDADEASVAEARQPEYDGRGQQEDYDADEASVAEARQPEYDGRGQQQDYDADDASVAEARQPDYDGSGQQEDFYDDEGSVAEASNYDRSGPPEDDHADESSDTGRWHRENDSSPQEDYYADDTLGTEAQHHQYDSSSPQEDGYADEALAAETEQPEYDSQQEDSHEREAGANKPRNLRYSGDSPEDSHVREASAAKASHRRADSGNLEEDSQVRDSSAAKARHRRHDSGSAEEDSPVGSSSPAKARHRRYDSGSAEEDTHAREAPAAKASHRRYDSGSPEEDDRAKDGAAARRLRYGGGSPEEDSHVREASAANVRHRRYDSGSPEEDSLQDSNVREASAAKTGHRRYDSGSAEEDSRVRDASAARARDRRCDSGSPEEDSRVRDASAARATNRRYDSGSPEEDSHVREASGAEARNRRYDSGSPEEALPNRDHSRGRSISPQPQRDSPSPPLPVQNNASAGARAASTGVARRGKLGGPRTVVCSICGHEFGRSSIRVHEKQCAKKRGQETPSPEDRGAHNGPAKPTQIRQRSFGESKQATVMLQDLFRLFDVDRSGGIGPKEFELAMQTFARVGEALDFEIDYTFAVMDTDHSGGVEYDEFEEALLPMQELFGPSKFISIIGALIRDAEGSS